MLGEIFAVLKLIYMTIKGTLIWGIPVYAFIIPIILAIGIIIYYRRKKKREEQNQYNHPAR
jgi:cytochrome c-type biogenesis protein CcmH/NrfF